MKLYGFWRSLATYRVKVGLGLKGLAAEEVSIDLLKGRQHDKEYVAVNPQAVVPALVLDEGGPPLFQSLAILEYLEESHPRPPLLPKDPRGRARVRGLALIAAADGHPLVVPRIRAYMEKIKAEARRTGYVETIFGRKCFIPGIRDANPARRAGAERQAINAPLQGSAADIIKRAMSRIPAALAGEGLKTRMLLQVHDELLFEAPEAEAETTARVVKAVMEGACEPHCELSVPLVVETGWAKSWDEAH